MSSPATAASSDIEPLSTQAQTVTSLTVSHSALVAAAQVPQKSWTIEDSEKLYRIQGWGEPYFSINAAGHVTVSPKGDRGGSLDLCELVESLKQRNLALPLLIRFSDILEDRIDRLNSCFARAIARYNYKNVYRGVFPVKCNQHRQLIQDLVRFGQPHHFGLEAGSKPELMIALATLKTPGALLICNGYKDREYIETAILAQRLGQTSVIVLEQIEEVELAITASKALGIKPILGVRAKLTTKGVGRWGGSTGDRAKFGLTIPEIIRAVNELEKAGMLDCLQLLHFHIGSQISSISVIKDAIREASHIYVELAKLGANMKYLDVGGGLGVDYDGSKTNFHASKNYNMQNYANDVVAGVKDACDERKIPVPIIISESGRAIASHQSVLVFDVLGTSDVPREVPEPVDENAHQIPRNLYEIYQSITPENYQEVYHDAIQFKEEAVSLFNLGYLGIAERAKTEQLYWACCDKIQTIARQKDYVSEDLEDLEKVMASIYYINLSVFQSVPDSWAINQLFPIMPINRLDEEPTQRGILADLTCDSDGKIDQFIDLRDVKSVLELHTIKPGEPYYLALFLGGAYQEIMGNLHNLFGDANTVHIQLTPSGYHIEHVVKGDTMKEVLSYVQYDAESLVESIRRQTESALQQNKITLSEAQLLLQNYERSLTQYTYLQS
ncbi:MAG: biosynthetic arginine decarboxylase [Microcoleus sp. PH2017_29_MFU_D_A]|jgi:arginine decarboxylase|uniref:biosynthetic arginine decarboxylase n=1 Tax=unclassified Microcoleus TaxID=2642155 RepID=UPI001D1F5F8D|nr:MULTISPECIES: biosynthetic arginine decarboxylase [unclassified Microcoleus]MCC3429677.1 biosynthetic arginine decarboxylase [Microcoleus sp. PH2017_04_SCI_O_A]MCC3503413.1 biosynthetic arginine decarboxylase [Microcoleus sp. PH2017_19_SFW_U_A]MCC3509965.1 biosynthetic arginine decarboxylase [Microcoleus sp. PH2017_17_BER_D_A]TAE67599.1 MAG: biosynthetic arginine decarboxylase [Oscillatoriales cyanobacterium]MCC3456014.1 biosynthetic arginine decarboxylase [Microcoleus sp. PH2017_08_TRC_O_A